MSPEIILRPVATADLQTLWEQQMDLRANGMSGSVPRTRDDFFDHWHATGADPQNRRAAIVCERALAGWLGSFEREGRREVCYWLGREWWGRGIASAALREFIAGEAQRPLYAGIAKRNLASVRVVEKCGFVFDSVGIYRNRAGEDIDEVVYRLD